MRTKILAVLVSTIYMFFASALFLRLLHSSDSAWTALLGLFRFGLELVPLCIIAAASRLKPGQSLIYYAILVYVGILGEAVIDHEQSALDVAPGVHVAWQIQAENSFVLLLLFGLLNLVPVFTAWGIATAVFTQRARGAAKHP